MKILHCIYDHIRNPWVAGGGAFRVYEIYRRFPDEYDITVVSGAYPGARPYNAGNTRYLFKGSPRDNYVLSTFCYAARTADYIRAHAGEYDIVIEDFAPYNPVFSFLWHRAAVIQLHQREGLLHLKKYSVLGIPFFLTEKFYHRFFRNAVPESLMGKEKYGLKGKIGVIPNGFDPNLLSLAREESDYILYMGRLHVNQKGLDTLSEAFDMAGCRLVIAGGGKDERKVRSLFSKAIGEGRAGLAGFVSGHEKEEVMRKCLFTVIPSRYEGQPLTVVEAAACGKPIVVSDIPELRYAVDAGFGISFKTGDPTDLAEKMRILLSDPSLRSEMGAKGRCFAANFTWDRIAVDYERFLVEVVNESRRQR